MHHRASRSRLLVPLLLLVVTAALLGLARLQPWANRPAAAAVPDVVVPAPAPVPVQAGRRPTDAPPPRPLTLVGLGDSVTAGSGCSCPTFVDLYARLLGASTRRAVHVRNLGVPGQTSTGLLAALSSASPTSSAVRAADVVTVTIGANDLDPTPVTSGNCVGDAARCYRDELARMEVLVGKVLDRIHALRSGRPTTIQVTGYWDVWKDGAVARQLGPTYQSAGDRLTGLTNTALGAAAAAHGATYVDLLAPFRGPAGTDDDTALLADDGDHPDAQGHLVIARALAQSPAAAALIAADALADGF